MVIDALQRGLYKGGKKGKGGKAAVDEHNEGTDEDKLGRERGKLDMRGLHLCNTRLVTL